MAGMSDVASKAGVSSSAVKAVFDAVIALTKDDQKVTVQGFGTFSKNHRAERQGHNPSTMEAITIAAKDVLHFKANKDIDMSKPKAAPAGRRR